MSPVNLVPPFGLRRPNFCYGWNMKYIFRVLCLFILHGQWHLANLCDGMCNVIISFHKPRCLQIFYVSKPFSMTSHLVWSSRIHIPNIVVWYTSYHWICHMLHHKQLLITLIVSWCIIPLLQLSILCTMLPLIIVLHHVPKFPTVVAIWIIIWLLISMTSTTTSTTSLTSSSSKFPHPPSWVWPSCWWCPPCELSCRPWNEVLPPLPLPLLVFE